MTAEPRRHRWSDSSLVALAKLGGGTLLGYLAVTYLGAALERQPATISAAIDHEAAERRAQHTEQLARLDRIGDGLAGLATWQATVEGAIRGKCPEPRPCRPLPCPPPAPPQVCPEPRGAPVPALKGAPQEREPQTRPRRER